MNSDCRAEALRNLRNLRFNEYPGRGFIIGRTPDDKHIAQVYWITARSESSRNRRLTEQGNIVRSDPIDLSKPIDPLTAYDAMREEGGWYVVSNGNQTDTVFNMRKHKSGTFRDAMEEREFEPDAPNYTSRITGIYERRDAGVTPIVSIAILSRSPSGECVRTYFDYDDLPAGYGYCVHTYAGDGNPLPSFQKSPYLVLIEKLVDDTAIEYWAQLGENRVAIAAKFINIATGESKVHLINRF